MIEGIKQRAEKFGDSIRIKRLKGMGLDLIESLIKLL